MAFRPGGAIKFFKNLDGMNHFNDYESVWISADGVELEREHWFFKAMASRNIHMKMIHRVLIKNRRFEVQFTTKILIVLKNILLNYIIQHLNCY